MKKLLLSFFAIAFVAALLIGLNFYRYCVTPYAGVETSVSLHIDRGSSLQKIAAMLKKENVIDSISKFKILTRIKTAEHKIKSGEYCFALPMAPLDVLDKLIRGKIITYSITIPEGSNIYDIAGIMESAGIGDSCSILNRITDVSFIKSLGIEGESLEGFLFPDTYRFTKATNPDVIIKKMVDEFKNVFKEVLKSRGLKTGLSEKEVIILASLVEKETASEKEKPVVAGVFFNRLKKRMRLECDPTVVYGIKRENPGFKSRLRKKHLRKKTPYNTYRIKGLPPGPICNPGIKSIEAVLNPAKVDYLFFVSKNNGTHKFSKTLREHNRAVHTYQK